ncbi:MAG: hypothetical protein IPM82_05600 [Saprospiraceae bacterium]|nr:hypothetical protein [Saprospiraceae bacterium]
MRTISYKDQKFAQDLIDKFKIADRYPQIAISVDMLDTGIDVPEIVNLVLFKPVYSKSKFWQMLGRGTRLREDLFGPGEHKQDFYVFDCCGNFEFFDMNPMGVMGNALKSISHRIFELRILLAEALREPQYQDESFQDYRNLLLDLSHGSVQALYEKRDLFRVKMRLATIEKFLQRESWEALSMTKVQELSERIGPLIQLDDEDEKAKLFDALLFKMQLALCTGDPSFEAGKTNIVSRAKSLATKANVPVVRQKLDLINRIQTDGFWKEITLPGLEHIRTELRELMKLLVSEGKDPVFTNFEDELVSVHEPLDVLMPSAPANYLERVKSIHPQQSGVHGHPKAAQQPTHHGAGVESVRVPAFRRQRARHESRFREGHGQQPAIGAVHPQHPRPRPSAALAAFSTFLEKGKLSADQQKFLEIIINNFEVNGVLDPKQLYEAPYTDINTEGLDGLFNDSDSSNIVSIIRGEWDGDGGVRGYLPIPNACSSGWQICGGN